MSFMLSVRRHAAMAIVTAISLLAGSVMAEEKRPNLVVIRFHSDTGQEEMKGVSAQGIRFEKCLTAGLWTSDFAAFLTGCEEFRAMGGRESIRPDVPLLSEAFRAAGYRTAVFGEWGLGEAVPFRPEDRGFTDFLVCGGPFVASAQDRWGNSEQDPWLRDRAGWSRHHGTLAELSAMESGKWLATCAAAPEPFYLQVNLPRQPGNAAAFLLAELRRLGLESTTITVLMAEPGLAAGADRDVNEAISIRWPGHLSAGKSLTGQTASVDLFPTLAALCRVPMFRDSQVDGINLATWMLGNDQPLPARTFFRCGAYPRSEAPDRCKSKNFIILSPEWRLEGLDLRNRKSMKLQEFEANQTIISELLAQYGAWWQSIRPGLVDPARTIIGDARQKLVQLSWSDWWPSRQDPAAIMIENPNGGQSVLKALLEDLADPEKAKTLNSISGHWRLHANHAGHYQITLWKVPPEASDEERTRLGSFRAGPVHVRAGKSEVKSQLLSGATSISIGIDINEGPVELEAWTDGQTSGKRILGAFFASVERIGERKLPDPQWKVQQK